MASGSLVHWQRWLAKLSLVLVAILLFEVYKDVFSGYARQGVAWVQQTKNISQPEPQKAEKNDAYAEKLNTIIQNLEYLQKQGQLTNVQIPGKRRSPEYALEGRAVKPAHISGKDYSPVPCELGMQPSVDWGYKIVPRFQLNPNKFLYPILKNEPIDQMIGLRQAILLAIRLNRTLAIPYFHNHNYGGVSQYNPNLPASLKLNIEILRRFVSVISVDELQRKCDGKFDVALLTGHTDVSPGVATLLKAQSEVQMTMLNTLNTSVETDFKVKFSIPTYPKGLKKGDRISIIPRDLADTYPKETDRYKCAVHPFPLSLFDVQLFLRKTLKLPNHKMNIFKMKDEVVYSAIWYYTQPPAFVHSLATEITEDLMNAQEIGGGIYNYMCLNYHKHSTGNDGTSGDDVDMNTLRNIINKMLEKIAKTKKSLKLSGIYISSPLSKQGQANEYRSNLKIYEYKEEIPVYSGEDIITVWKKNYYHGERNAPESMCSLLEDDTQDVLSLVEMQICTNAAIFIRSIGSSWAANVQVNRIKSEYSELDASIKGLMDEYHKSKT
uniref:uncharacterized protein LOC120344269 n=1 Tax=Styela clava TaxID=7725 RepID=UPI00193AACE8|nr:uncharacterized protein LOC120344269 [Styela clava]